MDRDDILYKQDNAEKQAIEIVNEFSENNQCPFMRYSLLWTAFNSILNSRFEIGRRRRHPLLQIGSKYVKGDYYISWGVHSDAIKQMFSNRGIECINLRLTSGRIGLRRNGTLYIPLHRSAKAYYAGKHGIEHNFRTLLDNMSFDEGYFRKFLNSMFSKNSPRFIMMNEDRTKFARILIEQARSFDIRIFVVQHGLTPAVSCNHIPFANESFAPLHADYICAWGSQSRGFLIENNVSPQNIIVTGNASALKKSGSGKGHGVVIIDQQFLGQEKEMEYTYSTLIEGFEKEDIDYRIYLRGTYNYHYLAGKIPDHRLIQWKQGSIGEVIDRSRVVVGFYSSAIVEAALNKKHVIAYDALRRGDVMGFSKAGISVSSSPGEICSMTENDEHNDYSTEFILYETGSRAAEKIVNAVMERV